MVLRRRFTISKQLTFLDGSYGTEFQRRGFEGNTEIMNIDNKEAVKQVHIDYLRAGADMILTNTFGGNRLKLKDTGYEKYTEEINKEAVKLAIEAVSHINKNNPNIDIVGDISSTGRFIKPIGPLAFQEAKQVFNEQAKYLIDAGIDMIKIETITDIKELKAAIFGVRQIDDQIPIIVSMSFDEDGKTITGTSVEAYVSLMNDLPVNIIGLNCGIMSKNMVDLVKRAGKVSLKPLCVSPNAGNPDMDLSYTEDPHEFAFYLDAISDISGVSIVGGCCGTTPEYVKVYHQNLSGKLVNQLTNTSQDIPMIASSRTAYFDFNEFGKIGERINPSSKKTFQEELNNKNFTRIYDEAVTQMSEGSDVIDLNLGVEESFKEKDVEEIVNGLDSMGSSPLSFDIQSYSLLEKALEVYPGRPVINSSSCAEEHLEKAITLMHNYGGILVVLAMSGTPKPTVKERLEELEQGLSYLKSRGINRDRVLVDPLVLPVGAKHPPKTTLQLINKITNEKNYKTTIGLSNLSHGLPDRSHLNASFASMAVYNGLNSAIMDTSDGLVCNSIKKALTLMGKEPVWEDTFVDTKNELVTQILTGKQEEILSKIRDHLVTSSPLEVSQSILGNAMKEIGDLYNHKKIYLPQLLLAAETVQPGFDYLTELVGGSQKKSQGKVMLATVEGDVHDIGKKIVGTILKSGGFEIIDIGVDVTAVDIVSQVQKHQPDVLGLSAMMTSTIKKIEEITNLLKQENLDVSVIAGGASLNPKLAAQFGCDEYAKDAYDGLTKCEQLIK